MKKYCLLFLLFILSFSVFGNSISGKIIDKKNKNPLEYAQISLLDLVTAKQITGTTSNVTGDFAFNNLVENKYLLRITFVGYELIEIPVVLDAKHRDVFLGVLQMQEISRELNQVNVVGQKSQMKFELDKKVFNVDKNVVGAGSSATELLRNIPSVEVAVDGNILLRNNKNVVIWINGRPAGLNEDNRTQILEQLPAENIEKVEIITNPSAKYSPEGSAGIINIVLKKSTKTGRFGSLTAGIDTKFSRNISANLFITTPKWEFNLNAGYRNDIKNMFFNSDRLSWNPLTSDTVVRQSRDDVKMDGGGYFARGNAVWHMSEKNDFGFNLLFTLANRTVTEDINNTVYKTGVRTIDYRFTDAVADRMLFDASVDYLHKFNKKGHEIKAYASLNRNNSDGNGQITQMDSLKINRYFQWSNSTSMRSEATVQVDYTNPISDKLKFEAGYKGEFFVRNNTTSAELGLNQTDRKPQYSLNNIFTGGDIRNSVYVNFSGKIKKLNWQVGLRGEYNKQHNRSTTYDAVGKDTLTVFDYNYPGLYPSFFLDYQLPKENQLQFSYTRRINRPKGRMINPFINLADSSNIEFGNPDLKPEYTNSLELNHIKSWENHTFTSSVYFRQTENVIQWVNYVIANNQYDTKYITPRNITNSQVAGVELMSKNKFFKIVDLTSTINIFYNAVDAFEYMGTQYDATSNIAWSGRMIANVVLPWDITAQLSGGYQSVRKVAQGETLPIWGIDGGLRKTFFDNKLNVNIVARDIAQTRTSRDIARGYNFYDYSFYQFNASMVGIVLTYNFGKPTKKLPKDKSSETNPLSGDF